MKQSSRKLQLALIVLVKQHTDITYSKAIMRSWWFYLTVELALARALIGKCLGTIEEKTIVIINIYVSTCLIARKSVGSVWLYCMAT
jgi:hypothetical protein